MGRRRSCATRLLAVAACFAARSLSAQAPPLSGEFPMNTYTTGPQHEVAAASRGDGTFVVVWTDGYRLSRGIEGEDGSTAGVIGQRFSELGAKIGGDFVVNTATLGPQDQPAIAMSPGGAAVVVWRSPQDNPSEIFGSGVSGQRLDSAGAKVGGEFLVNTYTTGSQGTPAVAMAEPGDFVAVWSSVGQDGSGSGIYGQRFDAAGTRAGPEFRVNTYTNYGQFAPSVAMDPSGGFVVVWESVSQDGDGSGVFGRLYDRFGAPQGPEFAVNSYTTGDQGSPSVAMDRAGNFVVAFQSDGPDLSGFGIWAHRFNASGESVGGPDFEVNSYTSGNQTEPSVSVDRKGGLTVAWRSELQDGAGGGVFAQRFDRPGFLVGSEFPVNTFTTDSQEGVRVFDDGAGFAAAWASTTEDGDGPGVYGRRQRIHPRELFVDTAGIGITDENGILEPGEAAIVAPAWSNDATATVALDATASNLTGPPGPTYTLLDATGDYGSVAPGVLGLCNDGNTSSPCYAVQIGGSRPAAHWDATLQENLSTGGAKTWTLHLGDSFADVPRSHPFYRKIETLLHGGITTGCDSTHYCPSGTVPRGDMALFIARGMAGGGTFVPRTGFSSGQPYDCSSGGVSLFADVSPTDSICRHVHYLSGRSVTLGCSGAFFCPGATVTRDAMASFIAKAIVAPNGGAAVPASYTDPTTARSYSCVSGSANLHFTDVPVSNAFCKHIHYLWAKGIVEGCSATQYCPGAPVARDAMAKFLVNAFGLELYAP